MSTIAKHNNLSTFINCCYGTINLSGDYSILNQNSNINVKNSTIDGLIPSFIINNGVTNIFKSNVNTAGENNIIIDNSKNYIDDQHYNNLKYSYIENGSLFPYSKISLTKNASFFDPTSNNYQLVIPIDNIYKNDKNKFINENGIENIGTGNSSYSTHFLNNGNYGYWGNKFGGQFINKTNLSINNFQDLVNCVNTIPRNLNGYTVDITYKSDQFVNLNIENFYNGNLNFIFQESIQNNVNFNLNNNNLNVDIKFLNSINKCTFHLNDNVNTAFTFKNASNLTFIGTNNYLDIKFENKLTNSLSLFEKNSYGNKVCISSIIENNDFLMRYLSNNNKINGNYISVLSIEDRIGDLVNDNSEVFESFTNENNESQYMNFTIDEVHPKIYRDVCDIGTIIGWNAKLPIPRGYYPCNGQKVAVDLINPNDEYYNGQLAYYLNGNLTDSTIQLPYLPNAKPSILTTDPNYCTDSVGNPNFIPQDPNAELIYIIKYNNNFENKKGRVTTTTPPSPIPTIIPTPEPQPEPEPPPVEPEPVIPTNIPIVVNANIYFQPTTAIAPLTQNVSWGYPPFYGAVYTVPQGYISGENVIRDHNYAAGSVEWVINRVPEEYTGQYNGYYQLSGLRACIYCHQPVQIWSAQSWLYLDFTRAIIDCKNGIVSNIILHYGGHHNRNGADYTKAVPAKWYPEEAIRSIAFNPNIATEQELHTRDIIIEPNTVHCWSRFTITVQPTYLVIRGYGQSWNQHNNSYVKIWHAPTAEATGEFIING